MRHFKADAPNRLWVADLTRILTGEGVLRSASVRAQGAFHDEMFEALAETVTGRDKPAYPADVAGQECDQRRIADQCPAVRHMGRCTSCTQFRCGAATREDVCRFRGLSGGGTRQG